MLTLFSFSTGSCGNCLYVSNGTEALLVDAGVGIRTIKRTATEHGLDMSALRGLLITHDHADHVKAAGHLARAYQLDAYATAKVHKGMTSSFRTQAPVPRSRCRVIEPDVSFMLGHFYITPFSLPHDASENVGYAISSAGETLVVMTDVGHITNNVRKYIAAADILVIETDFDDDMLRNGPYPQPLKERITSGNGHLSNAQTAQILAEHWHPRLRTICLCHISGENNRPELPYLAVAEALATRGLRPGEDYQLIVLQRREPTPVPAFRPRGLRAALFDLDGTLINTEPQYSRIWKAIGERFLDPPQPTFHLDIKGTTLTQILNRYFPDPVLQRQIEEELDRFEANDMAFEYFDGAVDFVHSLREQGVKTAIVTSSNRTKMEVVYRKLPHVRELFDAILTSEDFAASKPAPDCFLAAARRLAVPISQCAVFEDAYTGLAAAMRSGMLTIGLATSNPAGDIASRCHYVAQDWHHISYPQLCQLINRHASS